jgi:ABC-2 type transport system ATP-binding protein
MIVFDRVCFGYPQRKPLFENLSLVLEPGHIYGLLGKNGEGKSTLRRNVRGSIPAIKGKTGLNTLKWNLKTDNRYIYK